MLKTILLKIIVSAALFALLFGFAATGGGTSHAQQVPVINISGRIYAADSNQPIANAKFYVTSASDPINTDFPAPYFADAAGNYTIGLNPGSYRFEYRAAPNVITYTSYLSATRSFTLVGGEVLTNVNIGLQRGPVISVSVIGADTGLPLGANVKLFSANYPDHPIDTWYPGENFRVSSFGLYPGNYVLQVVPPPPRPFGLYANWYYNGKDDWNSADRITIGTESKVITAVLKTLPSIKGFVLDRETLRPMGGITTFGVETRTDRGVMIDETVAETNGQFSTLQLSPGGYTLIATPKGFPTTLRYVRTVYSRTITVTNSAESVQVLMDNQPKISGTITDTATGLPIENICMAATNGEVTYSSANDYLGQCSDSQGHYSLIMPSGSYKLTYYPRTPATPYFTVTLSTPITITEPNSNFIINTTLQKGGLITATIKDALKKTNSRARFTLYNADTGQPIILPEPQSSDAFYSGALPTGRYKIKVEPYVYCAKRPCTTDPYISSFFNDKATLQEADIIEITSAEAKNIGTIFMYTVPPWLKQKLYLPLVNR